MKKPLLALVVIMITIFLTACSNNQEITATPSTTETKKEGVDYSIYMGDWESKEEIQDNLGDVIPSLMLSVTEVDSDYITFDMSFPVAGSQRLIETTSITAEVKDKKTSFSYTDTDGGKGKGTLAFRDASIIVSIESQADSANDLSTNTKVYRSSSDGTADDSQSASDTRNSNSADDRSTAQISSSYMPVNGIYNNGSDGSHEIRITGINSSSFKFSIYEGNGKQIFKEHTAVFEEQNGTTAVYRGQNYTLYFDCSEYATITLTGFEEAIDPSTNTFWNSNALGAG